MLIRISVALFSGKETNHLLLILFFFFHITVNNISYCILVYCVICIFSLLLTL